RLLASIEMDKAGYAAFRELLLDTFLEAADRHHVTIGPDQFLAAQLHFTLPVLRRGADTACSAAAPHSRLELPRPLPSPPPRVGMERGAHESLQFSRGALPGRAKGAMRAGRQPAPLAAELPAHRTSGAIGGADHRPGRGARGPAAKPPRR